MVLVLSSLGKGTVAPPGTQGAHSEGSPPREGGWYHQATSAPAPVAAQCMAHGVALHLEQLAPSGDGCQDSLLSQMALPHTGFCKENEYVEFDMIMALVNMQKCS